MRQLSHGLPGEAQNHELQNKNEEIPGSVRICKAHFPAPFQTGLEFNSPAHGTWNIVHTGMLVPESIQIYVCAYNCMRGVVLTAAEMNASDRFSFVIVDENDLLYTNLEDITIEGVTDVLNKRESLPKAVLLFTVCLHHFLGCHLNRVYDELEKRFPEVCFMRCFMDPIMQKQGLTPDQKLRRAIYEEIAVPDQKLRRKVYEEIAVPDQKLRRKVYEEIAVPDQKLRRKVYEDIAVPNRIHGKISEVTICGNDFLMDPDCDLKYILHQFDIKVRELPAASSWEEYQALAQCDAVICTYPPALVGAKAFAKRLDVPCIYMPASFDACEIRAQCNELSELLDLEESAIREILDEREIRSREALACVKDMICDAPITIDQSFHPRPLGLARMLIDFGFHVTEIYLDKISPEEEADFKWLSENAPELRLTATIHTQMRVRKRHKQEKTLSIGQKAAWFDGSPYFINAVEGAGLFGFDGIAKLAEMMTEAWIHEKDTQDLIIQKGWGCSCCL